jgi:large subunit ribosomal protein L14
MIQKNSILKPVDSCGVYKVKVFHVYKGAQGKLAFSGDFVKVSAKIVKPENPVKKKSKHRCIITKTKYKNFRIDGSFIKFRRNSLILLKKRLTPRGSSLKGPISRNIKRKKFISSFSRSI